MKLAGIIQTRLVLAFGAALACAASCIYIDDNLGRNFIPKDQIYDVKVEELPLDKSTVWMESSDSLSCYSSSRITVGSVMEEFGLTKRASAFTVVPILDTIDLGKNPKFRQFHFNLVKDTTSFVGDGQKNIIQNINVYELKERLDSTFVLSSDFTDDNIAAGRRITKGIPVYTGGDSLSFDMSEEYAMKYIDLFRKDPVLHKDQNAFLNKIPGIYMETDEQVSRGGRINMFGVKIKVNDSYYVTGNYAELKITSDYGTRTGVDTSFLFYFGPADRTNSSTTQSAFNICSQPTDILKKDGSFQEFSVEQTNGRRKVYYRNGEEILIEGGSGLKPVISAKGMRSTVLDMLKKDGVDPQNVIINKATIVFPFKFPDNYEDMVLYPSVLSPTCKLSLSSTYDDGTTIKYATYAGLTDASVDSENQGDINRSLNIYSPDISHHVQEIIRLEDDAEFESYDIWMLIMAYETVTTSNSSSNDMSSYYQNLAYANYYNNLYNYGGYGYGYGGYGYGYGYDSYGYGYNNYLNYAMMASMYSSSGDSTSSELQLDKDRYYAGRLYGTEANGEKRPCLKLIYSIVHSDN